jgi:hypothetical protein
MSPALSPAWALGLLLATTGCGCRTETAVRRDQAYSDRVLAELNAQRAQAELIEAKARAEIAEAELAEAKARAELRETTGAVP